MQFAATCPSPLHRKHTGGAFFGTLGALFFLDALFDLVLATGFFAAGSDFAAAAAFVLSSSSLRALAAALEALFADLAASTSCSS